MGAERVEKLIPFVHVADIARSIAFYEALGFGICKTYPLCGDPVWANLESGSAQLMLAEADVPTDPSQQAILFYLYSTDLGALRARLLAAGISPGEIVDGSPGPREEMRVADPDGYCLMVAQIEG
jgi:catechol 2,3-dioxygenase-like lactoylglutathione lyase family enzyme